MSRRRHSAAIKVEVRPVPLELVPDELDLPPPPRPARGYFLVGDAPPQYQVGQPHLWLTPDRSTTMHTANLLMRLAGYSIEQFGRVFPQRTNLFPIPARRWATSGKHQADAIKRQASAVEAVGIVIIGQEIAAHFGMKGWPYLTWAGDLTNRPVAVIPHPSGRSSFWKEPESKARAGRFFQGLLESVERTEEVSD